MVDLAHISKKELGKLFDHSVLPKNACEREIREGCRTARAYNCAAFYSATSYWTPVVREELAAQEAKLANAPADGWALEFIRQAVQENILSGVDDGQGGVTIARPRAHHQAGTGHHGCGHPQSGEKVKRGGAHGRSPSLFIRSETQYMRSATNPPGPLPVWHAPQR